VTVLAAMVMVGAGAIYCFFVLRHWLDTLQCRGDRRQPTGSILVPSHLHHAESFLDVTGTPPTTASLVGPLALMESPAINRWPALVKTSPAAPGSDPGRGAGGQAGREEITGAGLLP